MKKWKEEYLDMVNSVGIKGGKSSHNHGGVWSVNVTLDGPYYVDSIVRFYGACFSRGMSISLVIELCENGSLKSFIFCNNYKSNRLSNYRKIL